jgi:sugar lactone lactonase YvrE
LFNQGVKMKKFLLYQLFLIVFLFPTAFSAQFSGTPQATDQGSNIKIDFTVSEYTDVTVEILDASKKVIRHLASGKLGPNPPLPFAANSLTQALLWDKKDDDGNPVSGDYEVKVNLGLNASFDRIYGENGKKIVPGYIKGAAVDSSGNIYVLGGEFRGNTRLVVFTRSGQYLRTLNPYPGYLAEDKVAGFGRVDISGAKAPKVYQGHTGTMLPELHYPYRQGMAIGPQGWLVLANTPGDHQWYGFHTSHRRALIMGLDGSCPRDSIFGPLFTRTQVKDHVNLALSPDGRYLYAAGLSGHHVVYRSLLDSKTQAQPFLGTYQQPGNDNSHFYNPHGVAVDSKGNIYVSDYMNNRVMVFDSSGTFINQFFSHCPDQLQVNPKTDEIYVLSLDTTRQYVSVVKYSSLPALDSIAVMNLSWTSQINSSKKNPPVLALDHYNNPPLLWIGGLEYGKTELTGIQDNGQSLVRLSYSIRSTPCWAGFTVNPPGYIAVDPDETVMYAGCDKWSKVNLATGAITASSIRGRDVVFGPDGYLYAWGISGYKDSTLYRYDKNGTRVAFAGGAMSFTGPQNTFIGPDMGSRGLTVVKNGDIYIHGRTGGAGDHHSNTNVVRIYDPSGNLKKDTFISLNNGAGGIQVDWDGNIYIAMNSRPRGVTYPDVFMGQFPNPESLSRPWDAEYAYLNYYLFQYGCLFKFPPAGGSIMLVSGDVSSLPYGNLDTTNVPQLQVSGMYTKVFEVQGPAWQYHGICPSVGPGQTNGDPTCVCFSPRFTVDEFGRIFFSDAFRYSVAVIDNNKNEIMRFGQYGNPESEGPGSAHPEAAIPFAYPMYVHKVNNSVYVSDVSNRRVVRVRLDYALHWSSKTGLSAVEQVRESKSCVSAYPMPFSPGVFIQFDLKKRGNTVVHIFSPGGRLVKTLINRMAGPGILRVLWNGNDSQGRKVSAGMYIARVKIGKEIISKTLILSNG